MRKEVRDTVEVFLTYGNIIDKFKNFDLEHKLLFNELENLSISSHLEMANNDIYSHNCKLSFWTKCPKENASNKFLKKIFDKKIPLSFPNIVISGWAPWVALIWERYEWKGLKYVHEPSFSNKIEFRYEEEKIFYEKLINLCKKLNYYFLFPDEGVIVIESERSRMPWVSMEEDLTVKDIIIPGPWNYY